MFSKVSLVVLLVLSAVNNIYLQEESDEYVKLSSELELVVWDLEDHCSENAKSQKNFLMGKPNGLQNMIDFELEQGQYIREQSHRLLKFADSMPYDLQRNFTLLTKCGDYLLPEEDWKMLITFANKNEDLQYNQAAIYNKTEDTELSKSDYEEILQSSKDINELENVWSVWQQHISKYPSEYPEVLKLVNKAAKLNDVYNAKAYWEKFSDYEDLYKKADTLWEEIEPFYKKLHHFIGRRINHYYGTNYTDFIPTYLLGSNLGDDWSNIADIILPHPQLLYDINHNLLQKDITEVYRLAENVTATLNLGKLSKKNWKESSFNMTDCQSHVITYCSMKMSQVLTCPNITYSTLLSAHRNTLHLTIDRLDYSAFTQLLRPPTAITEAVLALGDIFAMSNLEKYGLLEMGAFSDGLEEDNVGIGRVNQMNALLLLALRVFPRLSYEYGVDLWRLGELEEEQVGGKINRNYWEIRKKFSGIEGVTNDEANYLNDVNILRNKPYINKFVGTILQFQILNHYQIDNIFDENLDIVNMIGADSTTFLTMLQERFSKSVPDLLNYHYSIDEISTNQLVEFFNPLFDYLETVPIEQGNVIPKIRTTSTTTTTTTTTTAKPSVKEKLHKEDQNLLKDAPSAVEKSLVPEKTKNTIAQVQTGAEESTKAVGSNKAPDTGMIAIIVIIITITVCLVAALLWRKYKRKPRTNNRRFET